MPELVRIAQDQDGGSGNNWLIYLLFLVAGLLVGGTWSAYQNGSRILTVVLALIAAVAFAAAVLWMIGAMT